MLYFAKKVKSGTMRTSDRKRLVKADMWFVINATRDGICAGYGWFERSSRSFICAVDNSDPLDEKIR